MSSSSVVQVIIVGGWSPGPLLHLKSHLHHNYYRVCNIVEPNNIPMPPFGGCWCCDIIILGTIVLLIGLNWLLNWILSDVVHSIISTLLHLVVVIVWFRIFAAVVVRRSIERGIQIVMNEIIIRPHHLSSTGSNNPTIVIGFSWGGAVRVLKTF